MSKVEVGAVYGRLTVVRLIKDAKNPKAECLCTCGNVVTPQRGGLANGRAKSCGCLRNEINKISTMTHGMSGTAEYRIFTQMKDRCNRPANRHYKNYGGRGIRVLYSDFQTFMADVGPRPDGTWIERLDNNGNYEPGNCAWVMPAVNQMNKRTSKVAKGRLVTA